MIASVQFRHFKALRAASLRLEPFNLFIGPNGSGKTSLIQALLQLRTLARQPGGGAPAGAAPDVRGHNHRPEIVFRFTPPDADIEVHLGCETGPVCDRLEARFPPAAAARWEELRARLAGIRAYLFDHYAMAEPAAMTEGGELVTNGRNVAAVLATMQAGRPDVFARLQTEFCRALPDYTGIVPQPAGEGRVVLALRLAQEHALVTADNLSQGALYTLAVLTLSFAPAPPPVACLEEADRGLHPRLLREMRDALYRLAYPASFGETRAAVQIVATTHSPFLLDLFREHPEEIVVASKHGRSATFERLGDRPGVREILREGSLGDLWFSGILGGVPEE